MVTTGYEAGAGPIASENDVSASTTNPNGAECESDVISVGLFNGHVSGQVIVFVIHSSTAVSFGAVEQHVGAVEAVDECFALL